MTLYKPGPYEVEITYIAGSFEHKQRLNCQVTAEADIGDPFADFTVLQRNGGNIALNTAVDAYILLMKACYATEANITVANLYKYTAGTYDKSFLSTYDINVTGVSGSTQLNHQTMLTFTTRLGNVMKINYMDDTNVLNTRIPIKDAAANLQAVANYLVGGTSWIIARDGSFPVGKLNSVGGQNEALFKRRNR